LLVKFLIVYCNFKLKNKLNKKHTLKHSQHLKDLIQSFDLELISNMNDNTQMFLKFMPYSSCINPSFWFELSRTKLEVLKLDDSFKSLCGYFSNCTSCDLPPIVNFDYSSFDKLVYI
jgi:hypothetical protein